MVDPNAQVIEHQSADVVFDLVEVVQPRGQQVKVGEEEERIVLVLEAHSVGERADVVSEMEGVIRRPVAGQYSFARLFLDQACLPQMKRPLRPRGEGFSRCHPDSSPDRSGDLLPGTPRFVRGMPCAC